MSLKPAVVLCLLSLALPLASFAAGSASLTLEPGQTGTVTVKSDSTRSERKVSAIAIDNTDIVTSVSGVKVNDRVSYSGTEVTITAGENDGSAEIQFQYDAKSLGKTTKKTFFTINVTVTAPRRKVVVTVVSTNKVVGTTFDGGYADPIFTTTVSGLDAYDTTTLTWDIFRTNACEEVGTYDLLVEGAARQGNYDLTFVGGTYTIEEKPPKPGFLLMLR